MGQREHGKSRGLYVLCTTEQHQVFDHFPQVPYKNMMGNFNEKVGRKNIFKTTNGNDSLHQDSNDNGVRTVNFATSQNTLLRARCSRNETFVSRLHLDLSRREDSQPDCSHIDRKEMAFECIRCTMFQGS